MNGKSTSKQNQKKQQHVPESCTTFSSELIESWTKINVMHNLQNKCHWNSHKHANNFATEEKSEKS